MEHVLVRGVGRDVLRHGAGQLERNRVVQIVIGGILPVIVRGVVSIAIVDVLNLLFQGRNVTLQGNGQTTLSRVGGAHQNHRVSILVACIGLDNEVVALLDIILLNSGCLPIGSNQSVIRIDIDSAFTSLAIVQVGLVEGLSPLSHLTKIVDCVSSRVRICLHIIGPIGSTSLLGIEEVDHGLGLVLNGGRLRSCSTVRIRLKAAGHGRGGIFISRILRSCVTDIGTQIVGDCFISLTGRVQQSVDLEGIAAFHTGNGELGGGTISLSRHGGGSTGDSGSGHRCGGCHSDEALENLIHCSPFLRNRNYFFLFHSYSVIA